MNKFLAIAFVLFNVAIVSAQSKMAHVNSQDVMAAMPSYNEAVKKLTEFQNAEQADLQSMIDDFQRALEVYKQQAEGMSPVRRQLEEEKLAKKEQAINERQQTIQRDIEAYSRELNAPIVEKLQKAIKNVADRGGYNYVVDITMVMIHNGPDLTKDVITEVLKLESTAPTPPPAENIKTN